MVEVARRAGVSQTTVSRVLNEPGSAAFSEETRIRVQSAMNELGYRPHLGAQSLKSRKASQVGVLLENRPDVRFSHPLSWEFLLGINEGLEHSGCIMSLVRVTDVAKDGGLQARALRSQFLDGVIVVNHLPAEIEESVETLLPNCIWLDANVWKGERCIRRDERLAGEMAVEKMLELGYRRLICSHSPLAWIAHYSVAERVDGIHAAARRAGIEVETYEWKGEEGPRFFTRLFPKLAPDVAVISPNGYEAHDFMMAVATQTRLQAGTDFAFACCDDSFHAGYVWHDISRVAFDRFGMGRSAADMMLHLLQNHGADCPSQVVQSQWIEGTTAVSRTNNRLPRRLT